MESNAAAARAPLSYGREEQRGRAGVRGSARTGARAATPSAGADESFASLLTGARAGADEAWTQIYRAFSPAVLGYLRGLGAVEAEDLTGEVFLQVVRDLRRFEGDRAAFKAWILAIAHHRFIDSRRRARRRPVELLTASHEPRDAVGDAGDEALASLGDGRVRGLLAALSPDQRAVLLMRIVGDLTVEEIGRALGKRPGAVKALQRRGLAALGRRLAEEEAEAA
jgi:RNA polymerase sigma factor (sigma-70 family)